LRQHEPQKPCSAGHSRNAQDTTKDRFLKRSLRTVGDILDRKGVDLFPEMSPELKATLKAFRATELWSAN